ncbi:hypothetical protein C8N47_103169 [Mangrovibacterium marinum]|uniref:Uncharacterized protein n=1 Tax=Mangrovibacterium marinum TaxID=1639118 RepID=A0A2T5C4T3_9BACT|nr:hypothetical protein C8N47_103169 [Mangrovibacterium marinum]
MPAGCSVLFSNLYTEKQTGISSEQSRGFCKVSVCFLYAYCIR